MPIIRYTCLVGSFLLGMLFLLDDRDRPASSPDRWTSVDSLRAMAHLGEPVHGRADNARFVQVETASSAPRNRTELAELAARENLPIMNAQANMDSRRAASPPAAKPRKPGIAARQVRVRTAVAESAPRISMEMFRPPSW